MGSGDHGVAGDDFKMATLDPEQPKTNPCKFLERYAKPNSVEN